MTITTEKTYYDKKTGFMKKVVVNFAVTDKKKLFTAFKEYNTNSFKLKAITHYMP